MKGLDHFVICVRDLDRAGAFYQQLGFTLTPRAQHPFGSSNRLVQLDGVFLELLCIDRPENIPPQVPGQFNFIHFNKKYLQSREGISMLVLDSEDAEEDHRIAKKAGLQTWPTFRFSRKARLPGGQTETVSFRLNFVTHPDMQMTAFFTCRQFNPEHFWQSPYQQHANSAQTVAEACLVAENPQEYAGFMAAFSQCEPLSASKGEVVFETARGNISIASPGVFVRRYETAEPDLAAGPQIGGLKIAVKDITRVERRAVADAMGVALVFEQI